MIDSADWLVLKRLILKPAVVGYFIAVLCASFDFTLTWPFIDIHLTNETFFDVNGWKWAAFSALALAFEVANLWNWRD